jgi:hypothetical protein
MKPIRWVLLFSIALGASAVAAACGDDGDHSTFDGGGDGDGATTDGTLDDGFDPFAKDGGTSTDGSMLVVQPQNQVLTVKVGQPLPTLQFGATLGGQTVAPAWSIDRGELGSIGTSTGVFTPAGTLGGVATISADYKGLTATTKLTVKIEWEQNGDPTAGDAGGGAGGVGGVGGEGPGGAVGMQTVAVLKGNPVQDPGLKWLYPYDGTVWPRGILAPLLQWQPGAQVDYDAVRIQLTLGAFSYDGTFAKPPVPSATPFRRHPIPQNVWKAMTLSADPKEDVTVTLTFAKGGTAYGPITQKWRVARGSLKGTIYYQSYGTNLAKNYCCNFGTTTYFGGATLAIKGGATDPTLVAGGNGNSTNCRVCHSVAAGGSALVTQRGENYNGSVHVDLTNMNAATAMSPADGRFAWGALAPDGTYLLSNGAPLSGTTPANAALWALPSGTAIATTGIPSGLRAGTPAFSPDAKKVAFNYWAGPNGDQKSLAMMDFDPMTKTFSNLVVLDTPPGTQKDWWPTFFPDGKGIVFHRELVYNGRDQGGTRSTCDSTGACKDTGTRAELWWVNTSGSPQPVRLDKLNGLGYLPTGPASHNDDTTLNYEPTISPVASGGYMWVVFTSRRLYGNVATINPWHSDPRFTDISQTPTTKKLWVAAIDLNATPGTDPSHPAFYIPGQELMAGNTRGYWVVDPCKPDGNSCETGDECCGGFCRQGADGGGLVCTMDKPMCAQEFEKCVVDQDCCAVNLGIKCIGGRCTQPAPN